nr:hypothetical protein CFP56_79091 [Quercus suber]
MPLVRCEQMPQRWWYFRATTALADQPVRQTPNMSSIEISHPGHARQKLNIGKCLIHIPPNIVSLLKSNTLCRYEAV